MRSHSVFSLPLLAAVFVAPGLWANDNDFNDSVLSNVVYVQTNNPASGMNAVLGYHRDPLSGELKEMAGSPFLTKGTGTLNPTQGLGSDDTAQEIVVTNDRRFLYTVNSGSNTIAGFQIAKDGSLTPVPGSPFAAAGVQPSSIGLDGAILYVANRGDQNPGGAGGSHNPNYAGFLILPDGSLIDIPWSKLSITAGSSPSQALIAPSGKLMFDSHLFETPIPAVGLPPFLPPFASALHSYRLSSIGQITPAAQAVLPAAIPPFIYGLQVHPHQKIVYAGLLAANQLAVFTYDDDGNLSFVGAAPGGGVGICWIALSPDSKTLYAATAVSDQVDVYSIIDPLHPQLIQTVSLNGPKEPINPVTDPDSPVGLTTTDFQLTTTPDGKFLYIVNHETTVANSFPQGNAIHILKINSGGTLSEIPTSPLIFPQYEVPANAHPLGIVAY